MIRNDTLNFLLPLLSDSKYNKEFFINDYFIGAFIGDADRFSYEYEIVLVYKTKPLISYHMFETKLMSHPDFSKINYYYEDESLGIFVFRVPLELEEDFDNIMQSDYFVISPTAKLKIIKFWNYSEMSGIHKALTNSKYEWEPTIFEKETFDLEEFKGGF